jgi:predicted SAM-dependent methyltransferase
MKLNVGCGQTPTPGWRNFDNSMSIRLAAMPLVPEILGAIGLLEPAQRKFIAFARANRIELCDATRRIPVPDGSADVVYSSHMLEHFDPAEARTFLGEARRVLRPGGIIRLAVPDIERLVRWYIESSDADAFLEGTLLCRPRPTSFRGKLAMLVFGFRNHRWMYDQRSLPKLLHECGFERATAMPPGKTFIPDHEGLNLSERVEKSLYVEAFRPEA